MRLIVGLGNPGKHYVNNRHNVGFRCVDCFARRHGIPIDRRRSKSKLGAGEVEGTKVVLVKPATFMSLSGEAVAPLLRRYGLSPKDLIVIYDDLDLPMGKVRIRERGSAGGHKGMKSIIACLGSQDFARIRVGIAPPEASADRPDAVQYVLSDFSSGEKKVMADVYPLVADAIDCLVTEGVTAAMNRFN
jgi:PTH1 family peptidyl-tRNA hydrolase